MKRILAHKSLKQNKAPRTNVMKLENIDSYNNNCVELQQKLQNKAIKLQGSTAYHDLQKYKQVRKDIDRAIEQEQAKINSLNHLEEFNIMKIRNNERYLNNPNIVLAENEKESNDPSKNDFKDIKNQNETKYTYFSTTAKNKYKKNLKFGIEEPEKISKIASTARINIKRDMNNMHKKDKHAQVVRDWSNQNKALIKVNNIYTQQHNIEKNHKIRLEENIKRLRQQSIVTGKLQQSNKTSQQLCKTEHHIVKQKLKYLKLLKTQEKQLTKNDDIQSNTILENENKMHGISTTKRSIVSAYTKNIEDIKYSVLDMEKDEITRQSIDMNYYTSYIASKSEFPPPPKFIVKKKSNIRPSSSVSNIGFFKNFSSDLYNDEQYTGSSKLTIYKGPLNQQVDKERFKKLYIDKCVDRSMKVGKKVISDKSVHIYHDNLNLSKEVNLYNGSLHNKSPKSQEKPKTNCFVKDSKSNIESAKKSNCNDAL